MPLRDMWPFELGFHDVGVTVAIAGLLLVCRVSQHSAPIASSPRFLAPQCRLDRQILRAWR